MYCPTKTFVHNHAAGLLVAIGPFLHAIWTALAAVGSNLAGTIWTKQIEHALKWLRCFFKQGAAGITRQFSIEESRGAGQVIGIGTDASPWGIGGCLAVEGTFTKYFYDKVTDADLAVFGIERGSCNGQQTLEGLAVLVALRTWSDIHDSKFFRLQVRGDNIGALSLLLRMRPSSPQQAIIARELAPVVVNYSFPPTVLHTPGLAHIIADGLSRMNDPSGAKCGILTHSALSHAVRSAVAQRPPSWYKTL